MVFVSSETARANLAHVATEIERATSVAIRLAAALTMRAAQSSTRFKDGPTQALRKSIMRGERGPFHLYVKADAGHALFVEEDTKAHIIRAKLARGAKGPVGPGQSRGGRGTGSGGGLLKFQIAGHWISKPFVKHPGTHGTHFMQDARDQGEAGLVRFLEAGITSITR